MKRDVPCGTLWVCVDCLLAREAPDSEFRDGEWAPGAPNPEPWSSPRVAGVDVTLGLLTREHSCEDPLALESECECEERTFSSFACDACDTHLAGSRHAYTWWAQEEE